MRKPFRREIAYKYHTKVIRNKNILEPIHILCGQLVIYTRNEVNLTMKISQQTQV